MWFIQLHTLFILKDIGRLNNFPHVLFSVALVCCFCICVCARDFLDGWQIVINIDVNITHI